MSAGYLNDETRTNESFIELSRETPMIFPRVSEQDVNLKWYATGDVVEVSFNEFAYRNQALGDDWAERIVVKGRISAQVKLSSGSTVSPDVLEPIYASSPLFSDIYIDARSSSNSIFAIVTPGASLSDIKGPDGQPLFDFDAVCSKDFFTMEHTICKGDEGPLREFLTRRRQVDLLSRLHLSHSQQHHHNHHDVVTIGIILLLTSALCAVFVSKNESRNIQLLLLLCSCMFSSLPFSSLMLPSRSAVR
jgi:hypothetical protein